MELPDDYRKFSQFRLTGYNVIMIKNILTRIHFRGKGRLVSLFRGLFLPKEHITQIANFPSATSFSLNHIWDSESTLMFFGCPESIREDLLFIKKQKLGLGNIIDVGANIGMYSIYFAKEIPIHGKVYAFEPAQELFFRLSKNVDINNLGNSLQIESLAINNTAEPTLLSLPRDLHKSSGSGSLIPSPDYIKVTVPSTTLDAYCSQHKIGKVSLIKIDVEGAELQVLEGFSAILKRDKPSIFFEVNGSNFAEGFKGAEKIFGALLGSIGYKLYFQNHLETIPVSRAIEQGLITDGNWWAEA